MTPTRTRFSIDERIALKARVLLSLLKMLDLRTADEHTALDLIESALYSASADALRNVQPGSDHRARLLREADPVPIITQLVQCCCVHFAGDQDCPIHGKAIV